MSKSITKSTLILAGTGIVMGIAYTPVPKHRPSAEVVANYLQGHKNYNPMKYPNNWNYSEGRKQQIQASLSKITAIRHQIRTQAEVYRRDHNTVITAVTPQQKLAIHSELLMARIAIIKQA
jgi:hypothetical protein